MRLQQNEITKDLFSRIRIKYNDEKDIVKNPFIDLEIDELEEFTNISFRTIYPDIFFFVRNRFMFWYIKRQLKKMGYNGKIDYIKWDKQKFMNS